jgi:2-polyprenyl-6-methoxyphenol hydroxylase-like FAD-dependent oxidoreductase
LTLAAALAQAGGFEVSVFDRADDHFSVETYNPDRSYTIDITGHGLRAARHIDITDRFDAELIHFKGLKIAPHPWLRRLGAGYAEEPYRGRGWTGSRGDICRCLQAHLRERHANSVTLQFGAEATLVDAGQPQLRIASQSDGPGELRRFDLVVGCDGGGSGVRRAIADHASGFAVEGADLGNHSLMLHLDQHLDELDPQYLYVLAVQPVMAVAGAINGPAGPADPRWFASHAMVDDFSRRKCLPTGKTKRCSSLVDGRVALLGDAGAPVPPIGQGVNAAMEGATVLARCLHDHRDALDAGLSAYASTWGRETDALRRIAMTVDLSQVMTPFRVLLASFAGYSALTLAKREDLSYAEAWERFCRGEDRVRRTPLGWFLPPRSTAVDLGPDRGHPAGE